DLASRIIAPNAPIIMGLLLAERAQRQSRLLQALEETFVHIRPEKDRLKLRKEVVRLAALLIDWEVGGLFVNHASEAELELSAVFRRDESLVGERLLHEKTLLGEIVETGDNRIVSREQAGADERLFGIFDVDTIFCLPLKHSGKVEGILLVGASKDHKPSL